MSTTATRITLDSAAHYSQCLIEHWGVTKHDEDLAPTDPLAVACAGSARRLKPTVGDLDFLAILPPAWTADKGCAPNQDPLFQRLNAYVTNPWEPIKAKDAPMLFGAVETPAPAIQKRVAKAIEGLKPGFKCAKLELANGVGVEIHRCERGAWGWAHVMRTGPEDLSTLLLQRWKAKCGTRGTDAKGSIEGWLVDRDQQRVACHSEREFFERVGLGYYAPEERDRLIPILRGGA